MQGTSIVIERRCAALALATAVPGAAAMIWLLRSFPPERYAFYPRCPVYEWTGLLCPGCGATRALAALLHGHLAEAWRFNGLFVALLPLLFIYAVVAYRRGRLPVLPNAGIAAVLLVAAVFTVVRNLV